MRKARLYVDFNEMIENDLVLLAKEDTKLDSAGNEVHLYEGLEVSIYEDDYDQNGERDDLVAEGIVVRNPKKKGWGSVAKWCCRISKPGVRNESEL